jgi:hypothetical protein
MREAMHKRRIEVGRGGVSSLRPSGLNEAFNPLAFSQMVPHLFNMWAAFPQQRYYVYGDINLKKE